MCFSETGPCKQTTFFRRRYDLWQSELWTCPNWNAAWLAAASQADVDFFCSGAHWRFDLWVWLLRGDCRGRQECDVPLRSDQTSFAYLHQIWSGVVAVLRICLYVSNAEILGTTQRFATAAPIKECSNEALKIITGVRTVVNFRAKSRKMGICNPVSIHQGLVAQFTVDNQCFLGKMHDRHLKRSRYMLWLEFQDVTFWRWDLLWFAVASL